MSISLKADPSGTFGEILVNGATVAKLPVTGNAVIPGLVGTVSQSGGVPTGAIIERGSNANGNYVRYADGTQICRVSEFSSNVAGDVTWTFPATFDSAPTTAISRQGSNTNPFFFSVGGTTGASCQIGGYTTSFARATVSGSIIAIGRWF